MPIRIYIKRMPEVVVFVGISVVIRVSSLYINNAYRDIHQENARRVCRRGVAHGLDLVAIYQQCSMDSHQESVRRYRAGPHYDLGRQLEMKAPRTMWNRPGSLRIVAY
jgi:hypothetical protein